MNSHLSLTPASVFVDMPIPKPVWIWEGQLARGCVTLLVGPPKAGKSLFVRNLIKAVTSKNDFLGRKTTSCGVAYLALEEHASFLQESLKIAHLNNESVHIHCGPLNGYDIEETFDELRDYCDLYNVRLLVIDPMAKFANISDTNDYAKVYTQLSHISHFARSNNIHIMIVHHSNKGNSNSTNQILGSTGIFGVSDGAFLLTRNGNQGGLQSFLRYGDSLESCNFEYDDEKNLIFRGLTKKSKQDSLELRVLDYVKNNSISTADDIIEALQIKRETLLEILKQLFSKGSVERIGRGNKGSPFKYSVPDIESLGLEPNIEGLHD